MVPGSVTALAALGLLAAGLLLRAQPASASFLQGLQLYSPMDNATVGAGAGTDSTANGAFLIRDLAGSAEDGLALDFLNGGATASAHVTSGAPGQIGEALTLDLNSIASNRGVTYGEVWDPGMGDYTVSLWFNTPLTNGTQFVAGKGNQSSSALGWSLFIENGSVFARVGGGSTDNRASQRFGGVTVDAWHHVALVVDNSAGTVFGFLDGSNTGWVNGGGGPAGNTFVPGTDIANANPLALGIRADGGVEFRGYLDDFAVWDRALTSEQIDTIYQNGLLGVAVPEPSTLLLLSLGALAGWRLRRPRAR